MDIRKYVLSFVIVFGLLATTSWADTYTGSVKYSDGLIGTAVWSSAELSWTVDNETNPGLWTYTYTFTVDAKDISYVMTGVWENFTSESIKNGTTASCELKTFNQQAKSAPGLPGDIYGMKCTPSGNSLTYSWSIVTNRGPMWDGFYAKSGKQGGDWVYAYNTGFGTDPPDPTIADGNNGGWVLVPGMTYHEKTVHDFATNRFIRIRNVIAPEDETKPSAKFIGHHVEVASENWVYVLDSAGQQIFRPKAMYQHIRPSFSVDITPDLAEWMNSQVPQRKVDEAKRIAVEALGVNYNGDVAIEAIPARELIASMQLGSGRLKHHEGRTMVMLRPVRDDDLMVTKYIAEPSYNMDDWPPIRYYHIDGPPRSYETAINFVGERAIRVESIALTPEVQRIVDVFREGLMNGVITGISDYILNIRLGTFFSPDEWFFEYNAYAWESEGFTGNPYEEELIMCFSWPPAEPFIPYCHDDTSVDFDYLRTTFGYRARFNAEWCDLGMHNGIRGNCLDYDYVTDTCQSWEFPYHMAWKHKDLGKYSIHIRKILPKVNITHCDGITLSHPRGRGEKLAGKFYTDLESVHVAMISTHGGMFGCSAGTDFYQFKKEYDTWVSLHRPDDDGLGKGRLRHLFLQTCDSMGWNHGPKHGGPQIFDREWLNWHIADGIRTICGLDGPASGTYGAHVTGLPFFSHYHLNDSIIDSYFSQELAACDCNVPVMIAFGSTLDETASTLFDGRFEVERAGTGWIAAATVITPHLTQHQACCLLEPDPITGELCIDGPPEECIARGGVPVGPAGIQCNKFCASGGITCPEP